MERAESITIQYTTLAGKRITYRSRGWEARIFQHEYDHLLGILYIDKLKGALLPYEEIRRLRAEKTKTAALPRVHSEMALM